MSFSLVYHSDYKEFGRYRFIEISRKLNIDNNRNVSISIVIEISRIIIIEISQKKNIDISRSKTIDNNRDISIEDNIDNTRNGFIYRFIDKSLCGKGIVGQSETRLAEEKQFVLNFG